MDGVLEAEAEALDGFSSSDSEDAMDRLSFSEPSRHDVPRKIAPEGLAFSLSPDEDSPELGHLQQEVQRNVLFFPAKMPLTLTTTGKRRLTRVLVDLMRLHSASSNTSPVSCLQMVGADQV